MCINPNKFELFDTSSSSIQNTSNVSTSSTDNSSSTTYRPYYPDTFNPGAIAGVAIGSFIFILLISISSYYIRRQRLYYLPYYNNYHPI